MSLDSSAPCPVLRKTTPSLRHLLFDRNGLWMELPCKLENSASTPSPTKTPLSADDDDGAAAGGKKQQLVLFPGPVIVGAGPSGLAVSACLKSKGIPSLIIERAGCAASLWRRRCYDRLCLHLPKQFCELPLMPFPAWFPNYPTKEQFLGYLENYVREFDIQMMLNETVVAAEYDAAVGVWRLRTVASSGGEDKGKEKKEEIEEKEYVCPWLVVATGENADVVMPEIPGMKEFKGPMLHSSAYRCGDVYRNKRVLVVGCGNSGMEVALDLCNYNALPYLVVRDSVHILPRDVLGGSTFSLSMWLLKWLPVKAVDRVILLLARLVFGDTSKLGLRRPPLGPFTVKSLTGKTPVLDVGTISRIRSGLIKVRPGIERILEHGVEFVDGRIEEFDAVLLATGYKSNVPLWLKEKEFFSEKDGMPRRPFPNGWKGENGLYAVGFSRRGLLGASTDAVRIAHDIELCREAEKKTK